MAQRQLVQSYFDQLQASQRRVLELEYTVAELNERAAQPSTTAQQDQGFAALKEQIHTAKDVEKSLRGQINNVTSKCTSPDKKIAALEGQLCDERKLVAKLHGQLSNRPPRKRQRSECDEDEIEIPQLQDRARAVSHAQPREGSAKRPRNAYPKVSYPPDSMSEQRGPRRGIATTIADLDITVVTGYREGDGGLQALTCNYSTLPEVIRSKLDQYVRWWSMVAGAAWLERITKTGSGLKARPTMCVMRRLKGLGTPWRGGHAGRWACQSCADNAWPCVTFADNKFWLFPLRPEDRDTELEGEEIVAEVWSGPKEEREDSGS